MNKNIILYVIIGLFLFILLIITFFPGMLNAIKDSGKSIEDKCNPGPGYTEESWRQHMSHHPKIYEKCLS